ncbi:hypothetical protein [Streptomyces sp. N2A]|uniref:hypothetical protein n=1 Tax=Streptomyces sp. N2A TaxID=3073936 RepID=UPI0028702593|nr:hypothetical protein [Streptomyces sp. N2A]
MTARASSSAASTDFVVGCSTAAAMVRVAMSTSPVNSTRSTTPLSSRTSTSNGVESISISSPDRQTVTWLNTPSGWLASERRVRAEPVVWRPASSRSNRR